MKIVLGDWTADAVHKEIDILVIEIDYCPLVHKSESLKMHWSTTPNPNQSDTYPECLRSLYSIKIPCIKQKFQYKRALFISVKSFISARARPILSYRMAIWLRAAPCWAEPVTSLQGSTWGRGGFHNCLLCVCATTMGTLSGYHWRNHGLAHASCASVLYMEGCGYCYANKWMTGKGVVCILALKCQQLFRMW